MSRTAIQLTDTQAELDRLRSGVRAAIDDLIGAPCSFWACPGPDAEYTPMATCNICCTIIDLRELLND